MDGARATTVASAEARTYKVGALGGRGEHIVLVLGHPEYYPRVGFSPDRAHALTCPFPADAFRR